VTREDRQPFAECLAQLGHVFGRPVDAALADAYWRALDDLPLERVQGAVRRAVRESRGFPAPAVLRTLAGADVNARLQDLRGYMRRFPLSYPTDLSADLKAAVRTLGGWARVGNLTADELAREFRAAYEAEPAAPEAPPAITANVRQLTGTIGKKQGGTP